MHLEVLEALGLQQKRDFSDKFSMCKMRLNGLDQRWSIAHFNQCNYEDLDIDTEDYYIYKSFGLAVILQL